MNHTKLLVMALLGSVAGLAGYFAYTRSSAGAAVIVVFTVALLLFMFLSKKRRTWDSLSMLTNPFWGAILAFLVGFSYASLEGRVFGDALVFALGTCLVGGAAGMFLGKYWNIGS